LSLQRRSCSCALRCSRGRYVWCSAVLYVADPSFTNRGKTDREIAVQTSVAFESKYFLTKAKINIWEKMLFGLHDCEKRAFSPSARLTSRLFPADCVTLYFHLSLIIVVVVIIITIIFPYNIIIMFSFLLCFHICATNFRQQRNGNAAVAVCAITVGRGGAGDLVDIMMTGLDAGRNI